MQENTKSVQLTTEFANSHDLDGLLPRKGERSSVNPKLVTESGNLSTRQHLQIVSNVSFLPIHADLFSGGSVKYIVSLLLQLK